MRLNRRCTFPFLMAVLTVGTVPARADPITAVFDVVVKERESRITFTTEPFERSFTLFMTLDPARPSPSSPYGPPTFSPVPLPGPSAPSGLELTTSYFLQHHTGGEERGEFEVLADVHVDQSVVLPGRSGFFSQTTELRSSFDAPPSEPITLETFPLHLSTPGLPEHNFTYEVLLGFAGPTGLSYTPDSYQYRGRATLREIQAPVVPEPATLALVGGGLELLAAKRQRRRKQTRS